MRHILTKLPLSLTFIILSLSILLSACATRPPETAVDRAIFDKEVLHRFVRFANGSYGFDFNLPVSYHRFTNEPVMIPRSFVPAKRQFRGAWVATVHNLDIGQAASREAFQYEFSAILDVLQDWNMNAIIFQVSPLLDAFFPSRLNPWSQFLTGRQGAAPAWGGDWDPLKWMIAETHRRGMEFHAWFNPYRVTASNYRWLSLPGSTGADHAEMSVSELLRTMNAAGMLADNNFAVQNPGFVYRFNGRLYLDPGLPAVRQRVVDTVREVIENYDVDAIHFDDYFYPYPAGALLFGMANEDRLTFERYGLGAFPNTPAGIEAWRRENNTALIRDVRAAITAENERSGRAIQLGISPFGIWEHRSNDPRGSNTPTGSLRTFSGAVFSDTRLWVQENLIDYIVPQIYWSFDQGAAPYAELVRWWASVVQGTNVSLYIGHANYKHLDNAEREPAWMNPAEIVNQLRYNQLHPEVSGSVFFRFRRLLPVAETEPRHRAANQSIALLRAHFQSHKTIVPPMPHLQSAAPAAPVNVMRNGNTITWSDTANNNSRYFVIYRIPRSQVRREGMNTLINDPFNIVARVWRNGEEHSYTHSAGLRNSRRYAYVVTAFNAAHIESAPSTARER